MKKKEFIEKYGIEAYQRKCEKDRQWREEHKEACKNYLKEYRLKNKERLTEYDKTRRETKKDEDALKHKKYYESHKDAILERTKQYYRTNKEKILKYQKDRYDADPEIKKNYSKKYREKTNYNKKYRDTKNGRAANLLSSYKKSDIKSNRDECTLTRSWIIDKIFTASCIYCGDSDWKHLGCDRIDNSKPHTPENCVCSCGICNIERGFLDMSIDEFKKYRLSHPRECDIKYF